VPAYAASAETALGASGFEILARALAAASPSMTESAQRIFTGWLGESSGRADASTVMKLG